MDKKTLENRQQIGTIVFGGAINTHETRTTHITDAYHRGFHVMVHEDHARLYRVLPEETPTILSY